MTRTREVAVCEHTFREMTLSPAMIPDDVHLYRAPLATLPDTDFRGRFPHQVRWGDLQKGDIAIAIVFDEIRGDHFIARLDVWNIIHADHEAEEYTIRACSLVDNSSGETNRERLAGLVGV